MQGGCVCGVTRYELTLPPLLVHYCHCTACQRQTGSAFAINALIESTAFKLLPSAEPTMPGTQADPSLHAASALPAFAQVTASTIPDSSTTSKPPDPSLVCIPTESGCGQVVAQCPSCRTSLWHHYGDAGRLLTYIRVGTLDQPWQIDPDVEIYAKSRRSFVMAIGDGKPQFEKYYPDRMELLRDDAKVRFAALRGAIDEWKAEFRSAMQT